MPPEVKTEIELEIAHVLFIDTVGYSKLSINEEHALFHTLNRIVKNSDRFRAADAAGKLVRLPTGDGMALVFAESPEAPVQCALEISKALRDSPELPLRMGIHSGPVSRVVDVNDRANITGAAVNIAQRVMACGDTGHILLSKRAADDLSEYRHWRPYLHDLGECRVKHGTKLGLVNLYSDEVGDAALPTSLKRQIEEQAAAQHAVSRNKFVIATTAALTVLAIGVAAYLTFHRGNTRPIPLRVAAEKSVAVLPFENLSDDKQNAYFADGVLDEILS